MIADPAQLDKTGQVLPVMNLRSDSVITFWTEIYLII